MEEIKKLMIASDTIIAQSPIIQPKTNEIQEILARNLALIEGVVVLIIFVVKYMYVCIYVIIYQYICIYS